MHTTFTTKTILSLVLVLGLLLSSTLLTACSGQGGFSFNFGQGQSGGEGGAAGLSPIIILVLIIALVGIVALVALGALGGKK